MTKKTTKTEAEWRAQLTPEEYHVTREQGTERPFTGKYWDEARVGLYRCRCCGADLFLSDTKFDAGCGWPSFFQTVTEEAVEERRDVSFGMVRTRLLRVRRTLGACFSRRPAAHGASLLHELRVFGLYRRRQTLSWRSKFHVRRFKALPSVHLYDRDFMRQENA